MPFHIGNKSGPETDQKPFWGPEQDRKTGAGFLLFRCIHRSLINKALAYFDRHNPSEQSSPGAL
jgi:hypothetical protein